MSRQIGDVPTRTFNPGDVIFKEGDDAKSEAFLIHLGKVEIRKNLGGEEKLLRVQSKGELLGEFALFRNIPRSATAIAADAVTLMVIPRGWPWPSSRTSSAACSPPRIARAKLKSARARPRTVPGKPRSARARPKEERAPPAPRSSRGS